MIMGLWNLCGNVPSVATKNGLRTMWEKVKEIYGSGFAVLTTAWLLGHLIAIQVIGVVSITENNQWILRTEIVIAGLILILGIERFIKDLK